MSALRIAASAVAVILLGCGDRGHEARGVVREVQPEYGMVIIQHDDIPGLMPAMTMNFEVEPPLLETLEAGQVIDFTVVFDGKSYRVTEATPRDEAAGEGDGPSLEDGPGLQAAAPHFELTDQDGAPVSLPELRGKLVLVDFIFTNCPGPCPIQTASQVRLQRMLPPELAAKTWFVSISLDPERDTPEALREYAATHGADTANWSFLTGPPATVAEVVERYGVGTLREPDGNIQHLLITFLVDERGRVAKRYVGSDHAPEDVLADLRKQS